MSIRSGRNRRRPNPSVLRMSIRSGRNRRVFYLAARNLRSNLARWLLLAGITTAGLLVFVVMTALGRASTQQLGDAISQDLGVEGTADVSVPTNLLLSLNELQTKVTAILQSEGASALVALAKYPPTETSCRPLDQAAGNRQGVIVLLDYSSVDLLVAKRFQTTPNAPTAVCLLGMDIGQFVDADLSGPLAELVHEDTPPIVLKSSAATTATLGLGRPKALRWIVGFPDGTDRTTRLRATVTAALGSDVARSGLSTEWNDSISVQRRDSGGNVRNAGRTVETVYSTIGWAVLALSGAAVLVAQLMNTQNRMWFFGLARVWGATGQDLALIAFAEVGLLIATSATLMLAIVSTVRSSVENWSLRNFGQPLRLIDQATVTYLLFGTVLITCIGAALPAIRAIRMEPLAVLER
jgi:hypothetical protein